MRVGVPTEEGIMENEVRWETDLAFRISRLYIVYYLFIFFVEMELHYYFLFIFGSWLHHHGSLATSICVYSENLC